MKALVVSFSLMFLLSSLALAGESKVFTDADLEQYKSGHEEETYEYNQEALKDVHQKQAAEEAEIKRRERCAYLLHPEDLPTGNGFASAIIGTSMAISQQNAYHDCLAGVTRKATRSQYNNQKLNSSLPMPMHSYSSPLSSSGIGRHEESEYRYEGMSGKKYQYDLSNPSDRLRYEVDPSAQLRDSIDIDVRKNLDRNMGQYGAGGK